MSNIIDAKYFTPRPELYRIPIRKPNLFDLVKQIENDHELTDEEKKAKIAHLMSLDRSRMLPPAKLSITEQIRAFLRGILGESI